MLLHLLRFTGIHWESEILYEHIWLGEMGRNMSILPLEMACPRWPELLSTFLKMIWCTPISEDNERGFTIVKQRLLPNPDVVCWSSDHFVLAILAISGLGVWCIGVPVFLFFRLYVLKDRQSPENFRKYGFFIQGFEPQYWWWDIIVKRLDILIMNLVTYTSIATEEKAKLLTFPIISGCALGLCAWCQPFTNTQAEILDFLEMCLLSFRFTLFSMIAIMLIFNPSRNATWVLAGILVCLLACVCAYFAIHVLAQFLKGSAADMEESEDEDGSPEAKQTKEKMKAAASAKQNPLLRFAGWTWLDTGHILGRNAGLSRFQVDPLSCKSNN